jgi:crotonobetainyl-CoA:carnitine CoA-transferase CaiB-like acyl-CoA transferase
MHTLFEAPVTVVEMGDSLAGAFCGRLLGQLGARVVKVEPPGGSPLRELPPLLPETVPGGGPRSAHYLAVNAGKEVVTADLHRGEGRDLVESVLAAGGLGIMSGSLAQWAGHDLDPRQLVARYPSAIIGRVTLFGEDGPYANLVGGELQAQALGGLMNIVGDPSGEPLRIGGFPAQHSAGLALLSGFALALYRRGATGQGGSFATSVIETVANIEWKGGLSYQENGRIVVRGTDGDPAIVRTSDGFFAFFYLPADWPKVLALLGDPRLEAEDFATFQARDRNRAALLAIINESTSTMTKLDLYHRCQAQGLPAGYMATMSDLLAADQCRARGFFTEIDVNGRAGLLPGAPWRLAGEPAQGGARRG